MHCTMLIHILSIFSFTATCYYIVSQATKRARSSHVETDRLSPKRLLTEPLNKQGLKSCYALYIYCIYCCFCVLVCTHHEEGRRTKEMDGMQRMKGVYLYLVIENVTVIKTNMRYFQLTICMLLYLYCNSVASISDSKPHTLLLLRNICDQVYHSQLTTHVHKWFQLYSLSMSNCS